jgi:hypothetical protein
VLAAGGVAYAVTTSKETTSAAQRAAATTSWHGFSSTNWPPASWRPYSPSSPFNRPIGRARTHPQSAAMVRQILSWETPGHLIAGVARTSDDWGHPTYYAQPDDPVFTLRATAPWGRNAINGHRIQIPDAAQPAGGDDGHMTVVTPDGWEYDLWQVHDKPAGGGTLTFSWGGRLRIDGDGLGGRGTAAHFGNIAGMIRAQELQAGRIDHALFVVIRCTSPDRWFGNGVRRRARSDGGYVYPASGGGAPCPSGTMAPPMGARLQLTMTDGQINALRAPRWKKAILRALARYGGYVGDTGGDGFSLMFESSTMYSVFGQRDPLVSFAESVGLESHSGHYLFDVASGVDWSRYLRITLPPSR